MGGVGMIVDAEEDAVVSMLNEAIDSGITYFDTSPIYGKDRLSEHRLGLVFGKRRREVFLAGKCEPRDYDGIMKDVETSLKELQTDHFDLLQLHYWPNRNGWDRDPWRALGGPKGIMAAFAKLKEEGVIKYCGLTGHPLPQFNMRDDMRRAISAYNFDTILCFVNPKQESLWVNRELIPVAKRRDMGIIGMKMFGGGTPGALVGKKAGQASAKELFRYALSQPIHVSIPAVTTIDQLRTNVAWAREFKPMTTQDAKTLIAKVNVPDGVKQMI
jgi:aryl-alcohol dehydrogenase-like predicted oxidoreductase